MALVREELVACIDEYELSLDVESEAENGWWLFTLNGHEPRELLNDILEQHEAKRFAFTINVYGDEGEGSYYCVIGERLCDEVELFEDTPERDLAFCLEAYEQLVPAVREMIDWLGIDKDTLVSTTFEVVDDSAIRD